MTTKPPSRAEELASQCDPEDAFEVACAKELRRQDVEIRLLRAENEALNVELEKLQGEQNPCMRPDDIVAGALFDFVAWLTTRKERLVLSSADLATPAVDVLVEFAKMRALRVNDARVHDWHGGGK